MVLLAGVILTAALLTATLIGYCVVIPLQPKPDRLLPLDGNGRERALRLEAHVRAVASVPHNIAHYAALEAAAVYIETTLKSLGYTPLLQVYSVDGHAVRNIEAVIEPSPMRKEPRPGTLVIGAHYDAPTTAPAPTITERALLLCWNWPGA